MIPKQLQKEEFRFIRIKGTSIISGNVGEENYIKKLKAPYFDSTNKTVWNEKEKKHIPTWEMEENQYKWNNPVLQHWISNNGNIGLVVPKSYLWVDSDSKEMIHLSDMFLGLDTFSIKGKEGRGGLMYKCPGLDFGKIECFDYGDIREGSRNYYVLIPPSYHGSGKKYNVHKDLDIKTIEKKCVRLLIEETQKLFKKEKKGRVSIAKYGTYELSDNENVDLKEVAKIISSAFKEGQNGHPIWINIGSIIAKHYKEEDGTKIYNNLIKIVHGENYSATFKIRYAYERKDEGGDLQGIPTLIDNGKYTREQVAKIVNSLGLKEIKSVESMQNAIKFDVVQIQEVLDSFLAKGMSPDSAMKLTLEVMRSNKKTLKNNKIANELQEEYNFKSIAAESEKDEKLFIFLDGYYKEKGRNLIRSKLQEKYPEKINIRTCKEIIASVIRNNYAQTTEFNFDTSKIILNNGVFCLETKKLLDFSQDYLITQKMPVKYSKQSKCKKIKKFLKEIFVNKTELNIFQEAMGLVIDKSKPVEKAVLLVGLGGEGKGTLLSLIRNFLGSKNISSRTLQSLDSDNDKFAVADLFGKYANICNDISDKELKNSGTFKMLNGGFDMITGQMKFASSFQFINRAKFFFSCNKIPKSDDTSKGYFDRWLIFKFVKRFRGTKKENKNILKEMTTEKELSGFFNWCLKGLKRYEKQKGFTQGLANTGIKEIYVRESNPLNGFIQDHVVVDKDSMISKFGFFQAYVEYCKRNGLEWKTMKYVGTNIKELIDVSDTSVMVYGKQVGHWVGISLVETKKNGEKL